MITSKFDVIYEIFKDNMIALDMNYPPIKISFVGNSVRHINFEDEGVYDFIPPIEDVYGRLMLCNMDGIQKFFIVLKNKTIFSIDKHPTKTLRNIIANHDVIKEFESFKMIKSFADL